MTGVTPQIAALRHDAGFNPLKTAMDRVDAELAQVHPPSVRAVLNERGKTHGRFADHARLTQALKGDFAQHCVSQEKLTACMCESLDQIFHKVGRIGAGDPGFADHWVDIAGYAQLIVDQLRGKL